MTEPARHEIPDEFDVSELITERFLKKLPPPAVVCANCGSAICKDTKDRWVHVYSGLCTKTAPLRRAR